MYYNKFTNRNYKFTKGGASMAQQNPGVMLYKEWRVSKDSEAKRPTSGDNGSYPSTNPNPNPNPNPNSNPTSCCCDNAAGKPPRQPQRQIPPHDISLDTSQKPFCTPPVGAARSRPLRRSRSTFNEPPSCVSFGRLRASPTWRGHMSCPIILYKMFTRAIVVWHR